MYNIKYSCENITLCREIITEERTYHKFVEVDYYPIIGEKYKAYVCGNYEATIEVNAENIDAITFAMNDPDNDVIEYVLIEQ